LERDFQKSANFQLYKLEEAVMPGWYWS